MLNSEEPTGAGNEIIQIEDLAIHGGDLLEQKDYEGAFIAWLGVHQLAERIFGSDDPVSVDALRLAISSLDHIDRFNQADRLLKVVLGSNDDSDPIGGLDDEDLETIEWSFLPRRLAHRMHDSAKCSSADRVRFRRVRRGQASGPFKPHRGPWSHRIDHEGS